MVGFAEAPGRLRSASAAEGRRWAQRLRRVTGGLLVHEGMVQRAAASGDGADRATDTDLFPIRAFGAANRGSAAAGKAGYGVDGTQPAGVAATSGPAQSNHLIGNAACAAGIMYINCKCRYSAAIPCWRL